MVRQAQVPLPGIGGQVRFGRTAAASVRDASIPPWHPGRLPLQWTVEIDPADIILHVWAPGEPQAKQRPVVSRARITDSGDLRQGHAFTPKETVEAERRWGWIMKTARVAGPVSVPVGVIACFCTTGRRKQDADNCLKLLLDAGNGILWSDDMLVTEAHAYIRRSCREAGTDLLVWTIPQT